MTRKLSVMLCAIVSFLALPFSSCAKNHEITTLNGENGVEFCIDFAKGGDIKVLQLADLQLIDLYQPRNATRYLQLLGACFQSGIYTHEERVWRYVDEAIEKGQPDLLVLTGDNVYGETDDDGSDWIEFVEKMDSYQIPWLCIFGNHDNESAKGVMWQISKLKESKYCIFNRGQVSGNSNYNVLIKQGGVSKYLFYLLDTNGCMTMENPGEGLLPDNVDIDKLTTSCGLQEDQIAWFNDSYSAARKIYGEVPVLTFMHVAPDDVYSIENTGGEYFNDGINFGIRKENYYGFSPSNGFLDVAKANNCQGIFVGHQHEIATSTMHMGVRFTYGLKTGTHAYHDKDLLGSTQILLKQEGNFEVNYLFSELEYKLG